jgi:hypothetical protein
MITPQVFMVDFGLADKYTAVGGGHKLQTGGAVGGTPLFVSLACHGGSAPGRKDDLEGVRWG